MGSNLTRYKMCDTAPARRSSCMWGHPSQSQAQSLSPARHLHLLAIRLPSVADCKCSGSIEAPQLPFSSFLSAEAWPHPVEACISLLPLFPSNWEGKIEPTKDLLLLFWGRMGISTTYPLSALSFALLVFQGKKKPPNFDPWGGEAEVDLHH